MSVEIIIPIVGIALLLFYAILNRGQNVIVADAGPTRELTSKEQKSKSFRKAYQATKLSDGSILDTRDFLRVFVDGRCMEPRGIKDKSQVLVKPIKKGLTFKSQVKLEDVLLIYLHDKKVFKLRILQNDDDLNQLVTYRYENGEKHRSSRNHRVNDVIGIVKYIIN